MKVNFWFYKKELKNLLKIIAYFVETVFIKLSNNSFIIEYINQFLKLFILLI